MNLKVVLHSESNLMFKFEWVALFPQDNQEREKKKHLKLKTSRDAERQVNKELIKEGKKPVFVSKAERKAKELVTDIFIFQILRS